MPVPRCSARRLPGGPRTTVSRSSVLSTRKYVHLQGRFYAAQRGPHARVAAQKTRPAAAGPPLRRFSDGHLHGRRVGSRRCSCEPLVGGGAYALRASRGSRPAPFARRGLLGRHVSSHWLEPDIEVEFDVVRRRLGQDKLHRDDPPSPGRSRGSPVARTITRRAGGAQGHAMSHARSGPISGCPACASRWPRPPAPRRSACPAPARGTGPRPRAPLWRACGCRGSRGAERPREVLPAARSPPGPRARCGAARCPTQRSARASGHSGPVPRTRPRDDRLRSCARYPGQRGSALLGLLEAGLLARTHVERDVVRGLDRIVRRAWCPQAM
jgi:hypothetical protein